MHRQRRRAKLPSTDTSRPARHGLGDLIRQQRGDAAAALGVPGRYIGAVAAQARGDRHAQALRTSSPKVHSAALVSAIAGDQLIASQRGRSAGGRTRQIIRGRRPARRTLPTGRATSVESASGPMHGHVDALLDQLRVQ